MSTPNSSSTDATPQRLLEHHLKHLRLPTILREYDKVARECAAESVDYPRYRLRLTELELLDRERQYGLVDHARELGFVQVNVIDDDLGRSGSGPLCAARATQPRQLEGTN